MPLFFELMDSTKEILEQNEWCAGFSGGKDSTSMVTVIEYWRRAGLLDVKNPKLVISDTGVEFPFLIEIAEEMIAALEATGWQATRVGPKRKNKLYCKIFGQGTTPVNPGYKRGMRWCTSSTKISPMKAFRRTLGKDVMGLSAVRFGESAVRDKKLTQATCSAGGECGVQETSASENVYGPIIQWSLCQVYDWLTGKSSKEVRKTIPDLLKIMEKLVRVYDFKKSDDQLIPLHMVEPEINSLRFGCIGCPAIANDKALGRAIEEREDWQYLIRIHHIWDQLRHYYNRCSRIKFNKKLGKDEVQYGPIKMAVRKKYFQEILEIQEKSGVTIVTDKDIKLIYKMWSRHEYPRGWCVADEVMVELPEDGRIL